MWENFKNLNINPTNNTIPAKPTPPPKKEVSLDEFLNSKDYFYTPKFKTVKEEPTEKDLAEAFPALRCANQKLEVNGFSNEKFFIIRSNNVDDIHKVNLSVH